MNIRLNLFQCHLFKYDKNVYTLKNLNNKSIFIHMEEA